MSDIGSKPIEPSWVDEVIAFWFEELSRTHWFTKAEHIDSMIRDRFLALQEWLVAQDGLEVTAPRPVLAAVIVLDQFSRNMFRGSGRGFSADPIARRLSKAAIEQRLDTAMNKHERYFLYLPLEHSERREDQTLAFELIEDLGNEEWTRDAMAHKLIIDRFGRFPQRNLALGRLSTPDEIAFLRNSTTSF
jgi:uncharacterized protein (DUF924 family)